MNNQLSVILLKTGQAPQTPPQDSGGREAQVNGEDVEH